MLKSVKITRRFGAPETARKEMGRVLDLIGSRCTLQEPTAVLVLPVPEGGGSADLVILWEALRKDSDMGWKALVCDLLYPGVLPGSFFQGLETWKKVGLTYTSRGVPGYLEPSRYLRVALLMLQKDGLQVSGDLILARSGPETSVLESPGFWVWVSDLDPDPTA